MPQTQADELKTAVDKFLEDRGIKSEPKSEDVKKTDVKALGDFNLLVAIPTHSGELKAKTVSSLLNLCRKLQEIGIRYEVEIIGQLPDYQRCSKLFCE